MVALTYGTIVAVGVTLLVYHHIGWKTLRESYGQWFEKRYWTSYNVVEAASWLTKAVIIVPGLVFNLHWPWLYAIALGTSVALIWASNKKVLPTLIAFNTLWIWLSVVVLFREYL